MQDDNSIYNAVKFFLSEHLRPKRWKQLSFWTFRSLKSRIQRILYYCTISIVFGLSFIWNFEPLKVLRLYSVEFFGISDFEKDIFGILGIRG